MQRVWTVGTDYYGIFLRVRTDEIALHNGQMHNEKSMNDFFFIVISRMSRKNDEQPIVIQHVLHRFKYTI